MCAMTASQHSHIAPFKSLSKGLGGKNPAGSASAVVLMIFAQVLGASCCHTWQDALLKGHKGSLGAAKPWPSPAFCRTTVDYCVYCCASNDTGKETTSLQPHFTDCSVQAMLF